MRISIGRQQSLIVWRDRVEQVLAVTSWKPDEVLTIEELLDGVPDPNLRRIVSGAAEHQVSALTEADVLEWVNMKWPGIRTKFPAGLKKTWITKLPDNVSDSEPAGLLDTYIEYRMPYALADSMLCCRFTLRIPTTKGGLALAETVLGLDDKGISGQLVWPREDRYCWPPGVGGSLLTETHSMVLNNMAGTTEGSGLRASDVDRSHLDRCRRWMSQHDWEHMESAGVGVRPDIRWMADGPYSVFIPLGEAMRTGLEKAAHSNAV